ncbi:hypothetical protein [Ferrovibrio terrae]|uniref:hypothetical protein n=1 Tax=Ferrovibrio terrae TaxID=2594003 RepID=UPI003138340F
MKHDDTFGYALMAGFLIVLGLLGIVMASQAVDFTMQIFGLALAVFAVFYTFFAIDKTN